MAPSVQVLRQLQRGFWDLQSQSTGQLRCSGTSSCALVGGSADSGRRSVVKSGRHRRAGVPKAAPWCL